MPVTLRAADGDGLCVDTNIARSSALIGNMLDDLGEVDGQVIPLPGVPDASVLKNGMSHRKSSQSLSHTDRDILLVTIALSYYSSASGHVGKVEFFQCLSSFDLLELINAANFMEMRELYDSACKALARLLVGKSPEEIKQILRVMTEMDTRLEASDKLNL